MSISDSVSLAKKEISKIFERKNVLPENDIDIGFYRDNVGVCPLCGSAVTRSSFGYSCTGYREKGCKFSIGLKICGRIIPIAAVRCLLANGNTGKLVGFISKKGKKFDASLKLDNGKVVFDFFN